MTGWQKRMRAAMAAVVIAVVGIVGFSLRPRETRQAPPPLETLEPQATIVTTGGDAIQLKGASQDLRIEFDRQVTYDDGQTRLFGVSIQVDNRGGRNYHISGKEARIGTDQSSFDVSGDVSLVTNDGLRATGERATYTEAEKIVRVPGPVRFTRGRLSGTGVGFTYDEQRDTLWLLDQAHVMFGAENGAAAMDVTAGAFGFARADRYMRFERSMHMVRDGQVIDAAEATAHLFPDRDEPDVVELRGDARVAGTPGSGALRSMSARDMNLDYRDDGRSLQQATLAGDGDIQLGTKSGAVGQRLQGNNMTIVFADDDSVRALSARDRIVVTLPAPRGESARSIRSTAVKADGGAEGLTGMTFSEGVTYAEAATPTQGARTARARSLEASLDPRAGGLLEARFSGDFRFEEGSLRATSAEAIYQIAQGELSLTGKDGPATPQLRDASLTIDADQIDVTLSPRRMVADGNVRSVIHASPKPTADGPAATRSGLLDKADPVNVIADKLTYDETTKRGEYVGRARLFQGATQINADAITLDEGEGDLSAKGKVITTLPIAERSAAAGAASASMVGRAGTFSYVEATRRATYQTTATLISVQSELRADTLELFLAPGENALERLEGTGTVRADVDKRVVTGTKLSYLPVDDKYVVVGAPVRMVDADCQETTGQTLTFFKSSDRVVVDGNEEIRTQTKGGGKCPSAPPQ